MASQQRSLINLNQFNSGTCAHTHTQAEMYSLYIDVAR